MKKFEFMYNDSWYEYEAGWIYKQDIYEVYFKFCPVTAELGNIIDTCSKDQLQLIMAAIVHGFVCGREAGKADKAKEIRRALNLDLA